MRRERATEAIVGCGLDGNFVKKSQVSFDEVLCGTAFGAPEPC